MSSEIKIIPSTCFVNMKSIIFFSCSKSPYVEDNSISYLYILPISSAPLTICAIYGMPISFTTTPIKLDLFITKDLANSFGLKSSFSIASKTFLRASGLTGLESFITLDTVEIETPASFATSLIVGDDI